jgi:hypothetical protein
MDATLGLLKALKDVVDVVKDLHVDKEAMTKYLRILITFATFVTTSSAFLVYWQQPSEKKLVDVVRSGRKTAKQNKFADWLLNHKLYEITADIQNQGKTFRVPKSELDVTTLKMMDFVQKDMIATSSDLNWWQDHCDYTAKNKNLASVRKITRVFLYRSEDELQKLTPVLRAQKQAGIEVLVAPMDDSDRPVDYVLIDDGKIAGRLFLGKERKPIEAEFDFNKADIEAIQDHIEVIRHRAKPFEG